MGIRNRNVVGKPEGNRNFEGLEIGERIILKADRPIKIAGTGCGINSAG
jgi:hypothetical protein